MHVHLSLNSCMNLIKCMFHFSLGKYHYQLLFLGKAFPNDGCYESRWEMWKCRMKWRREILFSFGRFIAADCCFFFCAWSEHSLHRHDGDGAFTHHLIPFNSGDFNSLLFSLRPLLIDDWRHKRSSSISALFPLFLFSFIMPHDFCRRDVERFLWCWELEFSLAVKGRELKLWYKVFRNVLLWGYVL